MILRELVAKLGLDFDKGAFDKGEDALRRVKNVALSLAGIFIASKAANGLREIVTGTAELVDRTSDVAEALGVTTTALQGMGHAAKILGADQAALEDGLKFVQKSAVAAAGGSKETAAAFARLGVHVKDSNGHFKSADQLLLDVSDGMKKVKSQTEATGLAMQVLGRSGNQLIPFLRAGRQRISELQQEVVDLGASFDAGLVEQSSRFTDNVERLNLVWQGFKNLIANALLPRINALIDRFIAWRKATRAVMDQRLNAYMEAMITIGDKLWGVVRAGGRLLAALADQFGKLGAMVAIAGAVFGLLLLAMGGTNLLIAAIGFGLILLAEDIKVFFEGGRSAIGRLLEWWKKFAAEFSNPDNVKPGEHWMITFLRSVVELAERARKATTALFDSFKTPKALLAPLLGPAAQAIGVPQGASLSPLSNRDRAGDVGMGAFARYLVESVIGAPSVTQYRVQPNAGGSSISVKNDIQVIAQPGQDVSAIADQTAAKIDATINAHLNDAHAALVPQIPFLNLEE